jgi:diketogulonate reductase-like aldo/keto reductase
MNEPASEPAAIRLPDGATIPALGLGTWRYGESTSRRNAEVAALRRAFEIGYRLVDTAEMYGEGGAEAVVGEAVLGALRANVLRREDLFIASKVYPHNAGHGAMRESCAASLRRLGVQCLDLYLLHWRGGVPLSETVAAFEELVERGWIARWGVSNFDVDDLRELTSISGGAACAANQVYYSLGERGAEFALLPWQRQRAMPLMAYSPLGQGELLAHATLDEIAARHGATPAQVALAALLEHDGVIAIPKSASASRLQENWDALRLCLNAADRDRLARAFPPPRRKTPLASL